MAIGRNVWLPGAGVWACLPLSSITIEGGSSPSRGAPEIPSRKRRRGSSPSASCSRSDPVLDGDEEPGLGLRGDDHGASSSHDATCPICLGSIEEAGEVVLQWCMHRFCHHCIEEWSKVRRVCPLCKADYRGWYYAVQSNDEFHVRILPPIANATSQLPRGDAAANHAFSRFHLWRDSR